jgi:apolipoprotein D and lipocalin family protein
MTRRDTARSEGAARSDAAGLDEALSDAGGRAMPKLTIAALALLIAGLGVIGGVRRANGRQPPPVPAKTVDLDRDLGRWYEFARYNSWFEHDDEGVTAEYSMRPDGLIRVVNASRAGGPTGRIRWAEARARPVPGSGNAKLKVAFFGPFFIGNYWVLDHADDYAWSIVGEASRRYFWILTRDAVPPPDMRTMLIDRARALGYDIAALHVTTQPPG